MKILVILGGVFLTSEDLTSAYRQVTPKLLQCGINRDKTTPFSNHEIIMATPEEAIDAYLNHNPDKIVFAGCYYDKKSSRLNPFMLAQRILTRILDGDTRRFLYTNPISVPHFHEEANFFLIADIEGMTKWFGLT